MCNGSVGNIMRQIQLAAEKAGYETISFYGRRNGYADLPCERFGSFIGFWSHVIWTTITDRQGLGSYFITKKMVSRLREEKPDIIHMHNLHGYYLNYPTLFKYLRDEFKGRIVWTFHDCWPMTGHCPHFVIAKCNKWKKQCNKCPNKGVYPISWFMDSSKYNYKLKKKLFSDFNNMIITVPSKWMKENVEQSFLKDMRTVVVPNGIDLSVFYPRECLDRIKKYHIPWDKKVILGVASIWEERKGLDVFINLAGEVSEKYVIILVGLKKHQISKLLPNMIGIERTENKEELAELYSRADVFLNPSEEESFSLVTIEAMACGTPVVVLDSSAVGELVNEANGTILHKPSIQDYIEILNKCYENKKNEKIIRESVLNYSISNMTEKFLELYEKENIIGRTLGGT